MSRIRPLKRRCANNSCFRNVHQTSNLCRKHLAERERALQRKDLHRRAVEAYEARTGNGVLIA